MSIATSGTVRWIDLEGGFFGIVGSEGEQFYPLDLPEEFRQDGLGVRFEFEDAAAFTLQMWGRTVSVKQIEILD